MSDIPLREYVDARVRSCLEHVQQLDRLVMELRKADEKTAGLLRDEIKHRLEVLNEFSERMKSLEATFATREAVETLEKSIRNTIEALAKTDNVALESVKERVKSLEATRSEGTGRSSTWNTVFVLIASAAAVSAVVSVIITIIQVTG